MPRPPGRTTVKASVGRSFLAVHQVAQAWPSYSSIAKKGARPERPRSMICTMPGCESAASAAASFSKRRTNRPSRARFWRQHLDGHFATQRELPRVPHFSHPALAQDLEQLVAGDLDGGAHHRGPVLAVAGPDRRRQAHAGQRAAAVHLGALLWRAHPDRRSGLGRGACARGLHLGELDPGQPIEGDGAARLEAGSHPRGRSRWRAGTTDRGRADPRRTPRCRRCGRSWGSSGWAYRASSFRRRASA